MIVAKKSTNKSKRKPRITTRRVQRTENLPAPLPAVPIQVEEETGDLGPDGLTDQERLVVSFYCGKARFNAALACELAGYRSDNRDSLKSTAWRVIHRPRVQAAIARKLAEFELAPDNLKQGIAAQAQSSMANFLSPGSDGTLHVDLNRAAELGALGQLKEIKEEVMEMNGAATVIKRTIKIHDPLPARIALAKIQGLMIEKIQHSGEVQFNPITLEGDRAAAEDDVDD